MGRGIELIAGYSKHPRDYQAREEEFLECLHCLQSGTYIFVDHPAIESTESREIGHVGYEDVAEDRYSCLRVLTSERVKCAIEELDIQLINYKEI